jgi:hypothetical protein
MDNYNKYLIYKKKYLSLKKKMIQKGGTIQEVYQYLKENTDNYTQKNIQKYTDSLLVSNPNITVSEFISNVKKLYNITLPTRGRGLATADDTITVYTTGLAYFSIYKIEFVRALIENIVETCQRAGRRVRFIHFDMFDEPLPRYYRDERFIHGYLTLDIINAEIENNPNALLVDLAHIIHYYLHQFNNKPLMKYYSYEDSIPSIYDNSSKSLNINCFYPGFIGDMESNNFIRLFKFFQFQNDNIITWIERGIERNIKIREIYKGDTTTFCDFTIHKIDLSGLIANISSPIELNELFWS